jgi:hypothetical protein
MRTCEEAQPHLSAYLDGDLPEEARAEVRAHLRQCADCSGVLADLERIAVAARELSPIPPPGHIWLEVAGQVRLSSQSAPPAQKRPARSPVWQWTALAAALVLVTMAWYFVQGSLEAPAPEGTAVMQAGQTVPADGPLDAVNANIDAATAYTERALAELEGAADPEMADALRTNLQTIGAIDRAIEESRAAMAADPESEPARDSLFEALRRKISVLQATATLINQMRQGDQEGAARAAEGLGKKS